MTFSADAVRDEKVKVVRAHPADHSRGDARLFGPRSVRARDLNGKPVPGYRAEPNVAPDSATPTYVRSAS